VGKTLRFSRFSPCHFAWSSSKKGEEIKREKEKIGKTNFSSCIIDLFGFSHFVQGCESQCRDISHIRQKTPKRDPQDLIPMGGRKKFHRMYNS